MKHPTDPICPACESGEEVEILDDPTPEELGVAECLDCGQEFYFLGRSERTYDNFDDPMFDDVRDRMMFADPGGNSALRAASPSNPRNLPCPTCGAPDRLTPADRALHYQCDACADALERGGP